MAHDKKMKKIFKYKILIKILQDTNRTPTSKLQIVGKHNYQIHITIFHNYKKLYMNTIMYNLLRIQGDPKLNSILKNRFCRFKY